jgi:ABC-type transporter Mla MlaB component
VLRHEEQVSGSADIAAHSGGRLEIASLPDRIGLRLSGEADLNTREVLKAALDPLAGHGDDVHLELRDLAFVDVGAVTTLVHTASRCAPGRRVVLHDAPPNLRQMLDLLWGPVPAIELDVP